MSVAISCWQLPPQILPIAVGHLHLWRFRLDLPLPVVDALRSLLAADELQRSKRLLITEKQRQFIVARAGLRKILGCYLNENPAKLLFSYGQHGKPALLNEADTLYFNLAHSADWALLAVTQTGEVGVDIEQLDPTLDYSSLASRYFSQPDIERIDSVTAERKLRTFYRLWTLKESRLKQVGGGFSSLTEPTGLYCRLMPVWRNYLGALSCSSQITSIIRFQLPEIL